MLPPPAALPAPIPLPSSFRDPAGFVFIEDGVHKRAVTRFGLDPYSKLMSSGLYDELVDEMLLLPHSEESPTAGLERILVPEQLPYISYPYEWCFSQLRDAALLTLDIQRRALQRGLTLKDASAYNVQFRGARPVFIDTLSFAPDDGGPWVAYRQFCRHFLAPLLLAAYRDEEFLSLLASEPDGYPLAMTSRLLPWKTWLQPGALLHVHLHSRTEVGSAGDGAARKTSDHKRELTDSLATAISRLTPPAHKPSAWSGYYEERTHYTGRAEAFRQGEVFRHLARLRPELTYDLGANRGDYSQLIARSGYRCVALEMDRRCVEATYQAARQLPHAWLLPLRMNLCAPSPALGFAHRERMSLAERPRAGLLVALALIHHLRISGQAPFARIASYLAELGDHLLVEFVPFDDPMVRQMLQHRPNDAFPDYTLEAFRNACLPYWEELESSAVPDSVRTLHLFRRRRFS